MRPSRLRPLSPVLASAESAEIPVQQLLDDYALTDGLDVNLNYACLRLRQGVTYGR